MILWIVAAYAIKGEAIQVDHLSMSGKIIFSDGSTFHVSGRVNRHNVRTWGASNSHAILEVEKDSPKVKVFCAVSKC